MVLDLSQAFRFYNFPNNCTLDLFKLDSERQIHDVFICVRLENNVRKTAYFPSSTLLSDILEKLVPEEFKAMENPAVVVATRTVYKDNLRNTTLKDVGILSGRNILSLVDKKIGENQAHEADPIIFKKPNDVAEKPLRKKNAGKSEAFVVSSNMIRELKKSEKDTDCDPVPVQPTTLTTTTAAKNFDWGNSPGKSFNGDVEPVKMEKSEEQSEASDQEDEPHIVYIGERNALLYSLNSCHNTVQSLDDSFFELTVQELRMVLKDLEKIREGTNEDQLLTAKMRAIQLKQHEKDKFANYKRTIIRIKFPDRIVLQGVFKSTEPIADVFAFVRHYLAQDFAFHLCKLMLI